MQFYLSFQNEVCFDSESLKFSKTKNGTMIIMENIQVIEISHKKR